MNQPTPKAVIVRIGSRATLADLKVLTYAKLGMSMKLICQQTGKTEGQVHHLLRTAGIHLKDYRDGKSDFSKKVITVATESSKQFLAELKQEIKSLPEPTNK